MELVMSVVIGVLFSVGTYLILCKELLRVLFGTNLLTHGAHLLLITMARLKQGAPPILIENSTAYVDPIPQALILTSIVISFGVTAFTLVLGYRVYEVWDTDDLTRLPDEIGR